MLFVSKKLVRGGMSFNLVRRIVFDYCKKADRIIIASSENFEALKIGPEDYNAILPKIRHIGKLMSEKKHHLPSSYNLFFIQSRKPKRIAQSGIQLSSDNVELFV